MVQLKIIKHIFQYFLYAFLIFLIALSIFSAAQSTIGSSFPFLVVKSGSMEPVIHVGDIIITIPVQPSEIKADPKDGDVIVFFKPPYCDDLRYLIVHRAIGVTEEGFITKGDANSMSDPWSPVPPSCIVGKWTGMKIPYWTGLGYLSLFVKGEIFPPYGRITLVLLIIVNVLLIFLEFKKIRRKVERTPAGN
ncbi:MAG: signal peptidase I [Nitrososphaerota archaeon]